MDDDCELKHMRDAGKSPERLEEGVADRRTVELGDYVATTTGERLDLRFESVNGNLARPSDQQTGRHRGLALGVPERMSIDRNCAANVDHSQLRRANVSDEPRRIRLPFMRRRLHRVLAGSWAHSLYGVLHEKFEASSILPLPR